MDVILAKLIKFLNGCLFYDETYKILRWFVLNYAFIEEDNFTLERLMEDEDVTKEEVEKTLIALGLPQDFEKFKEQLWQFQSIRLDQIRSRMIGLKAEDILKNVDKTITDEEYLKTIDDICEAIDKSRATILVGALYPLCIATEFQTDMTIFGKTVFQHSVIDSSHIFNESDVIIAISATGRSFEYYMKEFAYLHPENATKILITQNKIYASEEHKVADHTIVIPGRYDGINLNYQIMYLFDILRLKYYQNYFLG